MSVATFTASTANQVVARAPRHKVVKVRGFTVDNGGCTADVRARLERVFNPDTSVGTPAPANNSTEEVAYLTVGSRLTAERDSDSLQDLRAFGRLQVVCDGIWATSRIEVDYKVE